MAARLLVIAPEVRDAIARRAPVVALETAVVTHGLPREPLQFTPARPDDSGAASSAQAPAWDARAPANLALAQYVAAVVRQAGAVPATVGMLHGQLIVGLNDAELAELASLDSPRKLSARDLGPAAAERASGGTTVAGTLAACAAVGLRVFATGGIGGVHRGWAQRPDVSADLRALATTPTAVVSAGAKAILDLPATVEALDTLGVPVLGVGTNAFPRFTSAGDDTLHVQVTVADAAAAAHACTAHWAFNPGVGVLVANPPPAAFAIPPLELEAAVNAAERDAAATGVHGAALTPYLLAHMARSTGGRSVDANIAVLAANAHFGAKLAIALAHDNSNRRS